jgi:hypothetical protein
MFNWPLRFFLEAYLEICFASGMKFLKGDLTFSTKTDSIDTVFAWFYLILAAVVPFTLIIVLAAGKMNIKAKGCLYQRLEPAFEEISARSWYTINFMTTFILRRLSLVLVIFFCTGDRAVF